VYNYTIVYFGICQNFLLLLLFSTPIFHTVAEIPHFYGKMQKNTWIIHWTIAFNIT